MANVPSVVPPEPGQSRCGNSYTTEIGVNGEIPGTDGFGSQYTHAIKPVLFKGTQLMASSAIPLFESEAQLREEIEPLKRRLQAVRTKLDLDSWAYTETDERTLDELVIRGLRLVDRALDAMEQPSLPGAAEKLGEGPEAAQTYVKQAAQHLRCAEYWAWRLVLYRQALREYEEPFEPGFAPRPAPGPGLGLPPVEPEPEPEEEEEEPKPKKAEAPKTSPWLIVGGLAAVAGGIYYFFFRKKR